MKVVRFGEDGWLLSTQDPIALAAVIDARRLDDVVPGQQHVLLRGTDAAVEDVLRNLPEVLHRRPKRDPLVLPAQWDGPDLDEVARSAGMSSVEVIATLKATTLTVAFIGFAPGFGYLTGLDERLHLPRRDRPRTSVPAGSIAIAAGYCAVYPNASPGGWHLVGRCAKPLFSPDQDPPSLLQPGDTVRFT